MNGQTDERWVGVWTHWWMDEWMDRRMDGQTDVLPIPRKVKKKKIFAIKSIITSIRGHKPELRDHY